MGTRRVEWTIIFIPVSNNFNLVVLVKCGNARILGVESPNAIITNK